MTERFQIYKCEVCGNIVEVNHTGKGQLVCCGVPMTLFEEKTQDLGREKHVPVAEIVEDTLKVTVGSVEHPMTEEHYIEWIELIGDGSVKRKFLSPGQSPKVDFEVSNGKYKMRAYCNIHGLWSV